MSDARRYTVTITTDTSGAATDYLPATGEPAISGLISQIRYVKDDYASGVDFTITAEATGETIWAQENVNASATVAPRQATHSTAGVASLYAAAGEPVEDKIALAGDRIKFVVASGGSEKGGTFHVIVI